MKKTLIILLFIGLGAKAQVNLVPNPGFENYKSCPFNNGQVDSLYFWYNPTNNSPDYFNRCFGGIDSTNGPGVPHNWAGYQNARKGNGYCGFYIYVDSADVLYPNPREYIGTRLRDTLKKDTTYCISFYVSLPNLYYTTAPSSIEVYFSKDSLYHHTFPGSDTLGFEPQFANDSNDYVTDTINWKRINGTFKVGGGEKYMMVGNFFSNKKTKVIKFPPYPNSSDTYLYIDDVSVYSGQCKTDSDDGLENIKKNTFFNVYPNPSSGSFFVNYGITTDATLTVYNLLGESIFIKPLDKNKHMISIDLSNTANGVYLIKINDSYNVLYGYKLIIDKE